MSTEHLMALVEASVISSAEKERLIKLRGLMYARQPPEPAEFGLVRELQQWMEEFAGRVERAPA